MMTRGLAIALCTLATSSVGAASDPFRLEGPLVSQVAFNTRAMSMGDIDGDGRLDVALINNDSAEIELLYQRTPSEITKVAGRKVGSPRWEPILENAPFLKESVLTGDFMYDLELVDVNLDGKLDLVYSGKRDRIGVKIQTEPGTFESEWYYDKEEPSTNINSIASVDVNNDGKRDLVALASGTILVFTLEPGGDTFPQPRSYRVGEENPQQLQVLDLNHDGRVDLAYMATSSDRALRVRYQHVDGGFGPEFSLPVRVGASAWGVMGVGEEERLVTIKETRSELSFSPLDATSGSKRQSMEIRNHPVPKSGTNPSLYAIGDFDGDGRKDVIVADADGAAVYFYSQDDAGEFRQPREFPSLNGITSLSPLSSGGRDALLVCSEKEGMVGVSEMSAAGRLGFPKSIVVPGQPIVAATADLDGDGSAEVIVATKDGRRSTIEVLRPGKEGFEEAASIKLGSIKRDPSALIGEDLDGDGIADLVLFIPREPTRFFRNTGDLKFVEVGEKDSVRTSQFEGVLPDRFLTGDFDGDGKRELLVAGKGYVRAYRMTSSGDLEIVDQANARSSLDELSGPLLFDIDHDGTNELLVYMAAESNLQILKTDDAGLFSYSHSLEMAPIALVEARVEALGGAAGTRLLYFGKDRFWSIPSSPPQPNKAQRTSYRTDLVDVRFSDFALGDLNQDGNPDLVAVDSNSNVIEILDASDGTWTSALFFKVFEKNRFVNSRGSPLQPREILIADFNADSKNDMLLLCHDRVLLYPQVSAERNP